MDRYTKQYSNGNWTLDASKFPPIDQAVLDSEIRNSEPIRATVERLAELEDEEEKGLLVHLSCKVGDVVYVDSRTIPKEINTWNSTKSLEYEKSPMFFEAKVVSIKIARGKTFKLAIKANCFYREEYGNCEYTKIMEYCNKSYPFSAIGKTVFLTREEAEQALKARDSK